MTRLEIACDDETRTEALGAALSGVLDAGDVVLLDGELGAGKTTLTRAICAGLGVDDGDVSSPTFVIAQQYEGRVPVAHLDAYRLAGNDAEELELLGWDRFAPRSVVLIEWGERVAGVLADLGIESIARLEMRATGETSRLVSLDTPHQWADRPGWGALARLASPAECGATPERIPTVCRVTGRPVPADSPTWPFADERARLADLYKWFAEGYTVSRAVEESDLEETE